MTCQKFPTNNQDSYLGSPRGQFETWKSYTNHVKTSEILTSHQDSYLLSPRGQFETWKSYTNHVKTSEIPN